MSTEPVATQQKYSLWGITFILIGAFSASVMFLLVKLLADANPFTLIFYRGLVQAIVAFLTLTRQDEYPWGPPEVRRLLFLRAAFGAGAVCTWFFAAQVLPLPDAITLHFTTPPFAAIFAVWFLGERWMPLDMIGAVACFMGVALIMHPTFLFGNTADTTSNDLDPAFQAFAVLMATVGAAMAGLAYVCVRAIGDRASALVMVLYYGAVSLPVAVVGSVLFFGTWDVLSIDGVWNTFLILCIGLLGVSTQWFINLGLQNENAATASLATSTQIVWTYFFELIFLHEGLNGWSVAGTALIVGYVLIVAVKKMKDMDNDKSVDKEETTSKDAPLLPDEESQPTVQLSVKAN